MGTNALAVGLLCKREVVQFLRRPVKIASLFIQPLMWLFLFGFGVRRGLGVEVQGFDYVHFILPGILGMKLLYSSSRGGLSVLRDRQGGFLKEVFVSPVNRMSILLGVSLGVVARAVIQGMLLLTVGVLIGIRFGDTAFEIVGTILAVILLMTAVGLGLVMIAIAVAWTADDALTYASASNFVIFPLFLLSGAIYPISRLPTWLSIPIRLNPLTYGVDALRQVILGPTAGAFPLMYDVMVIVGFLMVALSLGARYLRRSADTA